MQSSPPTGVPNLQLPRILCLHGGGTNARVFRAQCRGLQRQLSDSFRLVFADAPYHSQETGSDVMAVYSQWGPFRRWLRWRPEQPWRSAGEVVRDIDVACDTAMRNDTHVCGARGEWVAILGFSQGAKVAASLLYRQQRCEKDDNREDEGSSTGSSGIEGVHFRFGVLLAGRGPLVSMDPFGAPDGLVDASQLTDFGCEDAAQTHRHILRIPTVHVHGLKDEGLPAHRDLYGKFCDRRTRRLVEWDGDHRVPLKRDDVAVVVKHIRELASCTVCRSS